MTGAGLAFAVGVLVDLTFGLLLGSFTSVDRAVGGTAVLSVLLVLKSSALRNKIWIRWNRRSWAFAGLLVIFLLPLVLNPVTAWDARSVWFFHAKQIYYSGGLLESADWANPAWKYSHPEYPKLGPFLVAQVADGFGMWNEFLPKLGLLFLLVPLLLFALGEGGFPCYVFLAFLWGFRRVLLNGYMDGWLALYLGFSLFFLGRFLSQPSEKWRKGEALLPFSCGLICLGLALSLKSEGALFALSLGVGGLFYFGFSGLRLSKIHHLLLASILVPSLLWSVRKAQWGLSSYLVLDVNTLFRAVARLTDAHDLFLLFKYLLVGIVIVLIVFLVALICGIGRRTSLFYLTTLGSFVLGVCFIYAMTPFDLHWHLTTSAQRVLFTLQTTGAFSILLIVTDFLKSDRLRPPTLYKFLARRRNARHLGQE